MENNKRVYEAEFTVDNGCTKETRYAVYVTSEKWTSTFDFMPFAKEIENHFCTDSDTIITKMRIKLINDDQCLFYKDKA